MPKRYLTGITDQYVQPYRYNRIYGYQVDQVKIVVADDERRRNEYTNQKDQAKQGRVGPAKLYVFVVASLHVHRQYPIQKAVTEIRGLKKLINYCMLNEEFT